MPCRPPARAALTVLMAATMTLVAMGCAGGDAPLTAPDPEAAPTEVGVNEGADSAADPTAAPIEVATEAPEQAPPPEAERYLPELSLEDAASGPRPLLSWTAVDGAARYTVVLLGADATPYWAWSGSETAVYVGGFDDPDAVGPWVHEPMTWTVAATNAEGIAIAISDPGVVTP